MPVGSMPYLTRSGLPVLTLRSSFLTQLVLGDDLLDAAADQGELFVDGFHGESLAVRAAVHGCETRTVTLTIASETAPTASKALAIMVDRRFALVRRPADGQDVEAGGVVRAGGAACRKCRASSVSRRCLASSTDAAGRLASSLPVERTSTKTMQSPSRATRSSSP